jgi:hypothetical protein
LAWAAWVEPKTVKAKTAKVEIRLFIGNLPRVCDHLSANFMPFVRFNTINALVDMR